MHIFTKPLAFVYSSNPNLKPILVVAPDGLTLAVSVSYFSDSANNDARILEQEFQRDADFLKHLFKNFGIILVVRGSRDFSKFLQLLDIDH